MPTLPNYNTDVTAQSLMTPYMSLLLVALAELLESFCKQKDGAKDLWLCTVDLLHKSFMYDEGGKQQQALYGCRLKHGSQFFGEMTGYVESQNL